MSLRGIKEGRKCRRKEESWGERQKRAIHQNQKSAAASAKGRLLSLLLADTSLFFELPLIFFLLCPLRLCHYSHTYMWHWRSGQINDITSNYIQRLALIYSNELSGISWSQTYILKNVKNFINKKIVNLIVLINILITTLTLPKITIFYIKIIELFTSYCKVFRKQLCRCTRKHGRVFLTN